MEDGKNGVETEEWKKAAEGLKRTESSCDLSVCGFAVSTELLFVKLKS